MLSVLLHLDPRMSLSQVICLITIRHTASALNVSLFPPLQETIASQLAFDLMTDQRTVDLGTVMMLLFVS